MTALTLLGLEPHVEFGHDDPNHREVDVTQDPPVGFFDPPNVVNAPEINIYVTVDGKRVVIHARPSR
jgi:hypothetical protein